MGAGPALVTAQRKRERTEALDAAIDPGVFTSLDGYSCDEDNGIRDVMMSIDDPEQEKYFVSRLWEAGTFIMGRVTYEAMAGFWPTSSHPSAGAMNDIPKVVFSRTLASARARHCSRG